MKGTSFDFAASNWTLSYESYFSRHYLLQGYYTNSQRTWGAIVVVENEIAKKGSLPLNAPLSLHY